MRVTSMRFTRGTMDLTTVDAIRVPRSRAAVALGPGVVPLAGGTWLFSEPQPEVRELVDLTGLGWTPLELGDDGALTIAATCTVAELVALPPHPGWRSHHLVASCARALVASVKVWSAATVGGNLCLALPAGAMTSLTAALDATAVVWTPDGGERELPVTELVTGVRTTSLAPGELLRSVHVSAAGLQAVSAFRRAALTPQGRSGTIVVGRLDRDGTAVFTVTAGVPRPRQLRFDRLPGEAELLEAVDAIEEWYDDVHGAPDWRRAMSRRLAVDARAELAATGRDDRVETDGPDGPEVR